MRGTYDASLNIGLWGHKIGTNDGEYQDRSDFDFIQIKLLK